MPGPGYVLKGLNYKEEAFANLLFVILFRGQTFREKALIKRGESVFNGKLD